MTYKYDVVLSFAGEQRHYVERVAEALKTQDVNFFYDEFNETELWGKDLIEHFDEVYRKSGRHCVMFISSEYAEKVWPSHERRSALARALRDRDYILPVRFDETDVPGLPDTIYFMDARKKSPEQLATAIIQKLEKGRRETPPPEQPSFRKPKVAKVFNPYDEAKRLVDFLSSEMKKRCESLEEDVSFSVFTREGETCMRVLLRGEVVYSFDITRGGISSDKGLSFSSVRGEKRTSGYNAFGEFAWDASRETVVLNLHGFSLFGNFASGDRSYTHEEFFAALWEEVCQAIEEHLDRK